MKKTYLIIFGTVIFCCFFVILAKTDKISAIVTATSLSQDTDSDYLTVIGHEFEFDLIRKAFFEPKGNDIGEKVFFYAEWGTNSTVDYNIIVNTDFSDVVTLLDDSILSSPDYSYYISVQTTKFTDNSCSGKVTWAQTKMIW